MVAESAIWTMHEIAAVMLPATDTATVFQFLFIKFKTAHTTFHNNTAAKKLFEKNK
jgi:hypothetical protein